MKFNCKDLDIDDSEFGLTITFSENEEQEYSEYLDIDELTKSNGQYILLQKTYAEDEFEDDFCSIEFSDFDKSGELEDFVINLYRDKLIINYKGDLFEVGINIDNDKYLELVYSLKRIINDKGELKIEE